MRLLIPLAVLSLGDHDKIKAIREEFGVIIAEGYPPPARNKTCISTLGRRMSGDATKV
jgi:hypothetical protein